MNNRAVSLFDLGRKTGAEEKWQEALGGLLTDGVGSRQLYWWKLRDVRAAGVKVSAFLPMRIWRTGHVYLRNHRKIVVVDGTTGLRPAISLRRVLRESARTRGRRGSWGEWALWAQSSGL